MAKTCAALIAWLCLLAFPVAAAEGPSGGTVDARPAWSELTLEQQKILAPLAHDWNQLDSKRRKKWIAIAKRYPKMKPQAQERLQKRMADWAKLTPEQRRAARDRYQQLRKLPPEKRRQVTRQWRAYQRAVAAQPDLSPSDAPAPGDLSPVPAAPTPRR